MSEILTNWVEDTNRFNLAKPPDYWLKQLWDFDSSLVVVPSRQSPVYRLAQRRKLTLPMKMVNDRLFKESDTRMLASYSLIPVTSIMQNPNWSDPRMFIELHNRAPHRLGGAETVMKKIEEQESRDELQKQMVTNQILDDLGNDAWGYYNKRIGTRTHMYVPRTKKQLVGGRAAPAISIKNYTKASTEVASKFTA